MEPPLTLFLTTGIQDYVVPEEMIGWKDVKRHRALDEERQRALDAASGNA